MSTTLEVISCHCES